MAIVHGGSAVPKRTKRVFLRTGTAYTGYAVCYNWDAIDVTAENEALITASVNMWCDARQVMVEAPAADNNCHFAGVIDESSEGVVGPNWILIHEPGSVCKIRTYGTSTTGTGYRNTGQDMAFTIAKTSVGGVGTTNGQFYLTGFPGRGSAVLLAEGTLSLPADSYLKMARLQVGPECGGVQTIASMTLIMGRAASTLGVINHGRIYFGDAVTTGPETACGISVADGSFVGQHLLIGGPVTAASCLISVQALQAVPFTTGRAVLDASCWVTCTTGNLTASTQWMDLTWNGVAWVSFSQAKCT
jgi:hypothetical protein